MEARDPLRPLLDAAIEGDDVAMASLVRATQADLWRLCTFSARPGEEEDLVQEVYLRAMRSAAGFRGESTVRTWLTSIARHVCADHVRRQARERRLLGRVRPASEVHVQWADLGTRGLLAGLDPDRREAFVLTQMAGLSYAEAAEELGCPIGTIRSRVARARADLVESMRRAEAV
ncbi:MAG: sigma-70 family RNA polymerase sigma factor [Microthrixaceae bacterium]